MVRATSTQVYNPPTLPDYLKNVYNLKPIIGAPNDDEVRGIHAVIRAAQTVAQVPGVISLELTMSLAQHLFEVQMARYRDRYPCGAFPEDMVHTPPTLPSHVPVTLEPIAGAPSDEEIQCVYTAVRAYEQMAVVPSMFDPNVGMELSQHLFNIHFARYMSQASQGELGSKFKSPKKGSARSSARTHQPIDSTQNLSDEEPTKAPLDELVKLDVPSPQATPVVDDTPLSIARESKQVLQELVDALNDIKRVMITTQQCRTRGARGAHYQKGEAGGVIACELMNNKGELPKSQRLPGIGVDGWPSNYNSILTETQLAQYLQFYGIGANFIREGGTPAIKNGQRKAAETLLSSYVNS